MALTRLKSKDLLGLEELSAEEISLVLGHAASFKEVGSRPVKKVPALRGKTVVNLFFEPSTRTSTSFSLAATRLSADVVNIATTASSITKGETLLDTVRVVEAMNLSVLIMRHTHSGSAALAAKALKASVVNAGDGMHEHPTQGLLDLFTIQEKKGSLAGLQGGGGRGQHAAPAAGAPEAQPLPQHPRVLAALLPHQREAQAGQARLPGAAPRAHEPRHRDLQRGG